jgi:hypothetical protein
MTEDPRQDSAATGSPDCVGAGRVEELTPEQAISDARARLTELGDHLGHFVQAQADVLRAMARRAVVVAVLGFGALIVFVSAAATAVVLLLSGIAGVVGELVGERVWLGNMITAAVLFTAAILIIHFKLARSRTARIQEWMEKYEGRDSRP